MKTLSGIRTCGRFVYRDSVVNLESDSHRHQPRSNISELFFHAISLLYSHDLGIWGPQLRGYPTLHDLLTQFLQKNVPASTPMPSGLSSPTWEHSVRWRIGENGVANVYRTPGAPELASPPSAQPCERCLCMRAHLLSLFGHYHPLGARPRSPPSPLTGY